MCSLLDVKAHRRGHLRARKHRVDVSGLNHVSTIRFVEVLFHLVSEQGSDWCSVTQRQQPTPEMGYLVPLLQVEINNVYQYQYVASRDLFLVRKDPPAGIISQGRVLHTGA